MKILITGGFGYIGSNIAKKLIDENYHVTIVSKNNQTPQILRNYNHKYTLFLENFSNDEVLKKIIPQQDIIIHAAGTTVPENSTQNPIYDVESNLIPFLKLLESSVNSNVKQFIFLSSGGVVYGNTEVEKITESHSTNPLSSYGITKLTCEKYLQLFNKLHQLNYTIFRISNVYGPNQSFKNNQGVISSWINKLKHDEDIEIWGNKNIVRDYIYIDDVTQAIFLAIKKNITGLYNIGTEKGTSLNELANLIIDISGVNNKVIHKEFTRPFDVLYNVLDCKKYFKTCQWIAKTDLKEGLKKCLDI
ncbi:MAG: NAD-dependent epimerase/dehydratase family protein [Bacteroidia bacterium]